MNEILKVKVESLDDTKKLALAFKNSLDDEGLFVTLIGDIGVGKTQFIRYILQFLDVKEKITSPSFVILNEYKSDKFKICHFDFYRLENSPLKSIVSEIREYSKDGFLTFVEWAQFANNEIPNDVLNINVSYDKDNIDIRYFEFISNDKKNDKFIQNLKKNLSEGEQK